MTVNLLLSVPQMWEPPECQRMATAAKEAGVDSVKILFEPQCAAAYLLDDVVESRSLTGSMRLGSVTIVADPGGGTGDFVTFEITKGEGDSKYGLKQVGAARGTSGVTMRSQELTFVQDPYAVPSLWASVFSSI